MLPAMLCEHSHWQQCVPFFCKQHLRAPPCPVWTGPNGLYGVDGEIGVHNLSAHGCLWSLGTLRYSYVRSHARHCPPDNQMFLARWSRDTTRMRVWPPRWQALLLRPIFHFLFLMRWSPNTKKWFEPTLMASMLISALVTVIRRTVLQLLANNR